MTAPRPPFPRVADSSMLTAWRSCRQKFAFEYLHHWKPKGLSVHLHAGAAFAKGLEAARLAFYVGGARPDECVALGVGALLKAYGSFECPEDSAKSATRMAGALEYYFSAYPLGQDEAIPLDTPGGGKAIEFSFVHPSSVLHPETGEPILICGRSDMKVSWAGGRYIEDDKTTSSLGATWSRQWDLRGQFMCYTWGSRVDGERVDGVLVRGISILKTKYDTAQALINFPDYLVARWYQQTLRDLEEMKRCWAAGEFDYNFGESCSSYGGCAFKTVCASENHRPWLESYFERREWNPLTRIETLLPQE